jgi:hypothetical protein
VAVGPHGLGIDDLPALGCPQGVAGVQVAVDQDVGVAREEKLVELGYPSAPTGDEIAEVDEGARRRSGGM